MHLASPRPSLRYCFLCFIVAAGFSHLRLLRISFLSFFFVFCVFFILCRVFSATSRSPLFLISFPATFFLISSSGRIDLLGGFADYSGSAVLQFPVDCRTFAVCFFINSSSSIDLVSFHLNSSILHPASWLSESAVLLHQPVPSHILFESPDHDEQLVSLSTLTSRLKELLNSDSSRSRHGNELSKWFFYIIGVLHQILSSASSSSSSSSSSASAMRFGPSSGIQVTFHFTFICLVISLSTLLFAHVCAGRSWLFLICP